jgi:hypothetical protein
MADELDAHELLERALTGATDLKPGSDKKDEPRHKDEKRRRRDRSRSRSHDRKRGSRSRSRSRSRERRPRRCVVRGDGLLPLPHSLSPWEAGQRAAFGRAAWLCALRPRVSVCGSGPLGGAEQP